MAYSCIEDEGGPLGIGFQERVSNQSKLLRSNGRGGERWIKSSGRDPGQVSVRKTSESEPFEDASLGSQCRQNQGRISPLGQARRMPDYRAGGDRRKGGVIYTQASMRNCGNQCLDAKGEAQVVNTHEARVPKLGIWDGSSCSSDESSVMELERRGRVRRLWK